MASTESELPSIVRTLNQVTTAAQARSAIGAASVALHNAYPVARMIADDDLERGAWNELDQARMALELWYSKIVPNGPVDFRDEWAKKRHLVEKAYVVVSGVEGTAGYKPRTSNWEILRESVKEGMGTVTSVVTGAAEVAGAVVGGAAGAAGKGAGSLLGGLFGGLGLSGTFYVVLFGGLAFLIWSKAGRGLALGVASKVVGA
jgi:hypothetical protein